MASDGLTYRAKSGTCRMCQRVRNTEKYLKAVGEVHHGFATGHIWECVDVKDCDKVIAAKLNGEIRCVSKAKIEIALRKGRFTEYMVAV